MFRFRWKNKKQQNLYKSTTIPYPDAMVAANLCYGGAIYYHLKDKACLSDEWIRTYVSPLITKHFGKNIGTVLGRALFWRIMDPYQSVVLPKKQVAFVREKYSLRKNELDDGENPIAKVPLEVEGADAQMHLIPMLPTHEPDSDDGDDVVGAGESTPEQRRRKRCLERYGETSTAKRVKSRKSNNKQMDSMTAHLIHMDRGLNSFKQDVLRRFNIQSEETKVMNSNIKRLSRQSYRVLGHNSDKRYCRHCDQCRQRTTGGRSNSTLIEENDDDVAEAHRQQELSSQRQQELSRRTKLSKKPKDLYALWREWEHGINGNTPARMFTSRDRKNSRSQFSQRKIFWNFLVDMLARGYDSATAISMIVDAYGNQLVTKIIKFLIRDKKNKSYPRLLDANPNAQ